MRSKEEFESPFHGEPANRDRAAQTSGPSAHSTAEGLRVGQELHLHHHGVLRRRGPYVTDTAEKSISRAYSTKVPSTDRYFIRSYGMK